MLRAHLAPDFETVALPGGGFEVRERATGRNAAQVLTERLNSSLYAIYFAPNNPSGGAGTGGQRPPAQQQQPQQQPPDQSAAAIMEYLQRTKGVKLKTG